MANSHSQSLAGANAFACYLRVLPLVLAVFSLCVLVSAFESRFPVPAGLFWAIAGVHVLLGLYAIKVVYSVKNGTFILPEQRCSGCRTVVVGAAMVESEDRIECPVCGLPWTRRRHKCPLFGLGQLAVIWFIVAILGFMPPHFKSNEELKKVTGVLLESGRNVGDRDSFSLRIASEDGEAVIRVDSPDVALAATLKIGESIHAKLDGHYVVELAGEAGMLLSYEQYQARKLRDPTMAIGGIVLCGGFIGWFGYALYSGNRLKPPGIEATQ